MEERKVEPVSELHRHGLEVEWKSQFGSGETKEEGSSAHCVR